MFNPQRLSIARKRKMLNKKDFAHLIDVQVNTLTRWDQGSTPTDENIEAAARVLGFPKAFFFGPDIEEPTLENTSFRSLSSMTASRREAAYAAGAIGFMISDWIENRFELPSPAIPSYPLCGDGCPEAIARMLRQEWVLGEQPISNMIQLLEHKGARVFSLSENTACVDAFSLWRSGKPYVFLNNFKSAERSRFDAAHELGHLVMHQDARVSSKTAEEEADRFAAEFLMPKADVIAVLPRVNDLQQLMIHKARWKVSLAALTYRVHKLDITTVWRNRDLCITIAKRGYRKEEPRPIPRETSMILEKVLRMLWAEKTTQNDIASELYLPMSEVNDMVFGVLNTGTVVPLPPVPLALMPQEENEIPKATA
jgi:Zn-dependent peptidase ImmA (M78 family)/transcriptional regulator with XRE-family HTH domain